MKSFVCLAGFLLFGIVRLSVAAAEPPRLTLEQAHEMAVRNHPLIRVGDLKALIAGENLREVRSGVFPNVSADAVAVGTTTDNTRLAAVGGLNNPAIIDRNA